MTEQTNPLDRIKALLEKDPLTGVEAHESPSSNTEDDEALDTALGSMDVFALSPSAQDLLLALTDVRASVEPEARTRLVAAAGRGLQKRRDGQSPLPRLLFLARRELNESIEQVATQTGVDPAVLDSVEKGREPIRQLAPQTVASWVQHFHMPKDQVQSALILTLRIQSSDEVAAAAAAGTSSPSHDDWVREVLNRLEDDLRA